MGFTSNSNRCQPQSGSALIITLVLLTAITLAATVGMQQTTLQTRMVTNYNVQQQVRSASLSHLDRTYGNLQAMYEALGTDGLTDLMSLVEEEENALQEQRDDGVSEDDLSYDNVALAPYSNFSWDEPSTAELPAVASTTTEIYYDAAHPISSTCLLCNEGNSSGSASKYPFRVIATAQDSNGKIISTQVLGITLTGAGSD